MGCTKKTILRLSDQNRWYGNNSILPNMIVFLSLAPIEQNVNGSQGYYQLEYIRKPSKMLQDFKKQHGVRASE